MECLDGLQSIIIRRCTKPYAFILCDKGNGIPQKGYIIGNSKYKFEVLLSNIVVYCFVKFEPKTSMIVTIAHKIVYALIYWRVRRIHFTEIVLALTWTQLPIVNNPFSELDGLLVFCYIRRWTLIEKMVYCYIPHY